MSRAHRILIRTFGNGHNRSARYMQTSDMDGFVCDHIAEPILAEHLNGNGRVFTRRNRQRFVLDLGGSVLMDVDKAVQVRAAGYKFEMWEHHVGEYLHKLENMRPADDNPNVVILGGRWVRAVVSIKTAEALREALRPLRDEIVRKVQKRDQEMAARLEGVAARLDAQGVTMKLAPAREVEA